VGPPLASGRLPATIRRFGRKVYHVHS
jgi:hypothetical protein